MSEPTREELLETVEDLTYQFAYHVQWQGRACLANGGLSALEDAFQVLGWDSPHPVPANECQHEGCHEWATCGRPTKAGYKRLCGPHDRQAQAEGW